MSLRPVAIVGLLLGAMAVGAVPAAADQQVTLDEASFPLAAADQQVITGETTVEPGTEMTVVLRSADPEAPFLQQAHVRVQDDGEFAAVIDLSHVPANTTYQLYAHVDGDRLFERDGTVVACDGDCTDPIPETPTPSPADESSITVAQGDTAEIPVSMTADGTETLSIGSPAVNYMVNATVTDGDGDGEATVLFRTANAGTDGETLVAADHGDSVEVTREEPALTSALDPADYSYRLYDGATSDGEPETSGTIRVTDDGTADQRYEVGSATEFGFDGAVHTARQGETVAIPVVLADADAATVSVGSPASGYEINATVRDGDGDDRVVLLFDTASAGHDGETLGTASDTDAVSVESGSEVALDAPLSSGDYDLSLYRGADTGDRPDAIGTLAVNEGNGTAGEPMGSVRGDGERDNGSSLLGDLGTGAGVLAVGGVLAVAGVGVVLRAIV